jgi:MFS family permease
VAAFVVAVFGWGICFYGPPVLLYAIHARRGWPLPLISGAVTLHFLLGALVVANLPACYRRCGVPAVTRTGALLAALGIFGWTAAEAPWQLFAATLLSGAGWAATGGAAINAMVSPWFARRRPAALSLAYNGASAGGILLSPLWVAAIAWLGLPGAAAALGTIMVVTLWLLAGRYFARSPAELGLHVDGSRTEPAPPKDASTRTSATPALCADRSGAIGGSDTGGGHVLRTFRPDRLIAHLFSLISAGAGHDGRRPRHGRGHGQRAIAGRTPARLAAAQRAWIDAWPPPGHYALQFCGCLVFIWQAASAAADPAGHPAVRLGIGTPPPCRR